MSSFDRFDFLSVLGLRFECHFGVISVHVASLYPLRRHRVAKL